MKLVVQKGVHPYFDVIDIAPSVKGTFVIRASYCTKSEANLFASAFNSKAELARLKELRLVRLALWIEQVTLTIERYYTTMTTKQMTEKKKRKEAANAKRFETPAVIAIAPVETTEEITRDDVPPVGEPVSDQAANDPTINTATVEDDLIPNDIEADPIGIVKTDDDPVVAAADEESISFREKLESAGMNVATSATEMWNGFCKLVKPVNDAVVDAWIKFQDARDKNVEDLYTWAHAQNQKFSIAWNLWFPPKATVAQLYDVVEKLTEQNKLILAAVQGPSQVEPQRVMLLLDAFAKGHKTRAVSELRNLTGLSLGDARTAIETLA